MLQYNWHQSESALIVAAAFGADGVMLAVNLHGTIVLITCLIKSGRCNLRRICHGDHGNVFDHGD